MRGGKPKGERQKRREREIEGRKRNIMTLRLGNHLHLLKTKILTNYQKKKKNCDYYYHIKPLKLLELQISPNLIQKRKLHDSSLQLASCNLVLYDEV